jgi:hypothetical protein
MNGCFLNSGAVHSSIPRNVEVYYGQTSLVCHSLYEAVFSRCATKKAIYRDRPDAVSDMREQLFIIISYFW